MRRRAEQAEAEVHEENEKFRKADEALAAANERVEKLTDDLVHYARCGIHAPECKRCLAIWNGRPAAKAEEPKDEKL